MSQLQPDSELWSKYYKANENRDVRPVFAKWQTLHTEDGKGAQAVDLGCGDGTETIALLQRGWRVLAIDKESEALERLIASTPPQFRDQLVTQQASFEQIDHLPPALLIYAGFSLPFCSPDYFPMLWNIILAALEPGGWFTGQIFGVNDEWASSPMMNFHNAETVQKLLESLQIEAYQEVEQDGVTALQEPKHWHVFHIVARKPQS